MRSADPEAGIQRAEAADSCDHEVAEEASAEDPDGSFDRSEAAGRVDVMCIMVQSLSAVETYRDPKTPRRSASAIRTIGTQQATIPNIEWDG